MLGHFLKNGSFHFLWFLQFSACSSSHESPLSKISQTELLHFLRRFVFSLCFSPVTANLVSLPFAFWLLFIACFVLIREEISSEYYILFIQIVFIKFSILSYFFVPRESEWFFQFIPEDVLQKDRMLICILFPKLYSPVGGDKSLWLTKIGRGKILIPVVYVKILVKDASLRIQGDRTRAAILELSCLKIVFPKYHRSKIPNIFSFFVIFIKILCSGMLVFR